MAKKQIKYISSGRLWAWGWHRYEARTMVLLLLTMIITGVIGLIGGILLGTQIEFPPAVILVLGIALAFFAATIGAAIVKTIAPPIWNFITTKELE